jgi:hypothetical protein
MRDGIASGLAVGVGLDGISSLLGSLEGGNSLVVVGAISGSIGSVKGGKLGTISGTISTGRVDSGAPRGVSKGV